MRAYHFLCSDMRSGSGDEPAWRIGETRRIQTGVWPGANRLVLCKRGYHWSPSWFAALNYAPGPIACLVDVPRPRALRDRSRLYIPNDKGVSARRTLLAAVDASRELRLFAADCAERALLSERAAGREPDRRCWRAVEAARCFARGEIDRCALSEAMIAAAAAAGTYNFTSRAGRPAANCATVTCDSSSVYAAVEASAAYAKMHPTRLAGREWESQRLDYYLNPRFAELR